MALQNQFERMKQALNPIMVQEARNTGRLLIRQKSLIVAASQLPLTVPADLSTCDGQSELGNMMMPAKTTEISEKAAMVKVEDGNVGKAKRLQAKAAWNCRRKIRHSNYLSALQHARSLGHEGLNIYPCDLCGGLHIGNDQSNHVVQKRKKVRRKLNIIAQRLESLDREKRQLEEQRRALITEQAVGCLSENSIAHLKHLSGN
jgi:hypothetical protein